jgi:hypothetical protein
MAGLCGRRFRLHDSPERYLGGRKPRKEACRADKCGCTIGYLWLAHANPLGFRHEHAVLSRMRFLRREITHSLVIFSLVP